MEYDLSAGEIDLLFYPSDFYPTATTTYSTLPEKLANLPEDVTEDSFFGQDGVSGKDNFYFEAAPGVYAVQIKQ